MSHPCAVYNQKYLEWVRYNIHPIEYETEAQSISWRWEVVEEAASNLEPEVVVVTQCTISRFVLPRSASPSDLLLEVTRKSAFNSR